MTYLISPSDGPRTISIMGKVIKTEGTVVRTPGDTEDNLLLIKQAQLVELIAQLTGDHRSQHLDPSDYHNFLGTLIHNRKHDVYQAEWSADCIVQGQGSLLCHICGATFTTPLASTRHTYQHGLDKSNSECEICRKVIRTSTLSRHRARHKKVVNHVCPLCGVLVYRADLYQHMRYHDQQNKKHYCICGQEFENVRARKTHTNSCTVHDGEKILINYMDEKGDDIENGELTNSCYAHQQDGECYLDEHSGINHSFMREQISSEQQGDTHYNDEMKYVGMQEGEAMKNDYILLVEVCEDLEEVIMIYIMIS